MAHSLLKRHTMSERASSNPGDAFQSGEMWERFAGDVELVGEILDLIDRDLPQYVARLRRAVDDGDWALVARLAHTIKGTTGEVAAVHLPGLAVLIEQAALASDRAAVSALVPLVEAAATDLLAALRTWREEVLTRGGLKYRDRTLKEFAAACTACCGDGSLFLGGAETTINLDDRFTQVSAGSPPPAPAATSHSPTVRPNKAGAPVYPTDVRSRHPTESNANSA